MIIPKNSWFNTNHPRWVHSRGFLSVIDGQIINHHSSSDRKRSNPIFKKFKTFGACRKVPGTVSGSQLDDYLFLERFFFFDITASNFWLKETQFGCFWTIPTPNEYRERDQGNGRGLGYFNKLIVPDLKIVPVIFTFSEVYGFHFKYQSPWPDGKLDCYKLVPVYIISKINGNEVVHKYKK